MTPSLPRSVHIVDATLGPLVGDGRLRRVIPFAATATICLIVAIPTVSFIRAGLAVAGSVLIAATIIGSLVVPWHRFARSAQLVPPLLFLVATLLLVAATGYGIASPFVTMVVLPVLWLALYENRAAVLLAATLAGVALWLVVPAANVEHSPHGVASTALFIVCGAGMGVTLQGLVADARRLALALRDQQLVGLDAELKLADSEARFRDLADKSADVVWRFLLAPTPHFDYISPSIENILGYPPSYFLEDFARMVEILDDASKTAINRAVRDKEMLARFDFHFRHANGSIVVGETQTTVVRGGLQGVSRDVTELRHLQEITAALALHDPLTGLANRRLFIELLDADLARTERRGLPLAVAFLDLDDFKNVNDTYGHDAGDLVLCETTRRLLTVVRGADTVARIGGDEFVIVYEPNDANSQNLTVRIDRALSEPINITPTIAIRCPASIGIADTRTVGYHSAALLAAADEAMYEAKRARQTVRDAHESRHRTTVALKP